MEDRPNQSVFNRICCGAMEDRPNQSVSSTESAVVLWRIGQINMCLQQNLLWCYGGLAKSICVFNRICCGAMEDRPNQSVSSTESAVVLWRIGQINLSSTESAVVLWRIGQINLCLQQNLLWCYGG